MYCYNGSFFLVSGKFNVSVMLLNDAETDGKPQTAARPDFFCGKKGIKGFGKIFIRDMLSFFNKEQKQQKPVIRVAVNDMVVLKLRSADVTHGFALKGYGIYVAKGIEPGSTSYVKFKADRPGTFLFVCTVFCGDIHHAMQGTLVVEQ